MRMRRAHKDGKGDALLLDIVNEAAASADQRLVFDAAEWLRI